MHTIIRSIVTLLLLSAPVAAQQLPQIRAGSVLCNPSAKQAPATDCTATQYFNGAFGVVNNGVLVTSGSGVPSISSTLPPITITTSATTPLIIGGTAASSTLSLRSTSGVGTTDAIIFQVGNNGATEAGRITTAGNWGFGTASPTTGSKIDVRGASIFTITNPLMVTPDYGFGGSSKKAFAVETIFTTGFPTGGGIGFSSQADITSSAPDASYQALRGNIRVGNTSEAYAVFGYLTSEDATSFGGGFIAALNGTQINRNHNGFNASNEAVGAGGAAFFAQSVSAKWLKGVHILGSTEHGALLYSDGIGLATVYGNTVGADNQIGGFFDRVYADTGDSLDLVWGTAATGETTVSNAASIRVIEAGSVTKHIQFSAQFAGGSGSTNQFATMVPLGSGIGLFGIGTLAPDAVGHFKGSPSGVVDAQFNVIAEDNRAFAAGVGGGLAFFAKYNVGGDSTVVASIQGVKENATDGNFSGKLVATVNVNTVGPTEVFSILGSTKQLITAVAIPVVSGGSGATALTGLLQGNGTSAFTVITNSSTVGQVLRVTGAATYAWGALDLADSDAVTGALPVANGGTNCSVASGTCLDNITGFGSTGMLARTAAGTYAFRTITGTSNRVDVSNGDGVSGNPTINISTSYVGQATITTLGTIVTGVWNAGAIASSGDITSLRSGPSFVLADTGTDTASLKFQQNTGTLAYQFGNQSGVFFQYDAVNNRYFLRMNSVANTLELASTGATPIDVMIGATGSITSVLGTGVASSKTTGSLRNAGGFGNAGAIFTDTLSVITMALDTAQTDNTVCINSAGLTLKGTGALGICLGTSGRQFKTDLMPMQAGLAELIQIKFWNYRYKPGYGDGGGRLQYGAMAQDVEAVLPGLAGHNAEGETINYDWGSLLFVGLRSIQQLKADNDNLTARVERLEATHR